MDWKLCLKQVLNSQVFKDFKAQHPNHVLLTMFGMLPEADWEFHYSDYNPESQVFVFKTNPVRFSKQPGFIAGKKDLLPLNIERVRLNPETVVKKAVKAFSVEKNVSVQGLDEKLQSRKIVVLQNLKSLNKQVYIVTLLTRSMEVLSAKIDAATGEVVSLVVKNLQSMA
ncbi:hypothetical protein J7L02_02375 [Candidatus Woesearchaeota archaeon]|nr:hypothetical protein [Candidatus Woesearchaeota archaeon]